MAQYDPISGVMLGQYNPIFGVMLGHYNAIFGFIMDQYNPIPGVEMAVIKAILGFGRTKTSLFLGHLLPAAGGFIFGLSSSFGIEPLIIWCGRIQNRLHIFVLSRVLDTRTSSIVGGFCGTGRGSAHSFTVG